MAVSSTIGSSWPSNRTRSATSWRHLHWPAGRRRCRQPPTSRPIVETPRAADRNVPWTKRPRCLGRESSRGSRRVQPREDHRGSSTHTSRGARQPARSPHASGRFAHPDRGGLRVDGGRRDGSERAARGRSAHGASANAAKIRHVMMWPTHLPRNACEAAAPVSSKTVPAYAHSFSRRNPGASKTLAPRSNAW